MTDNDSPSEAEINAAILTVQPEVADDESPLNGTQVAADTTPPPPGNGFLEQWAVWSADSLKDLEEVCKAGLNPEERLVLFRNGYRFLQLATEGADDSTFKEHPEIQKELEEMALTLAT